MKYFKKLISAVLTICVALTMQLTVLAAHPFEDVSKDNWYNDAVDYVYKNSLMSGTATNRFSPEANMSRAMMVTVLYSMEGKPYVSSSEPFKDVSPNNWYYSPVVWAYKNGIVAGTSANTFSPDSNITREQMVAIFSKYATYKGMKITAVANLNAYSDRNTISGYAVNAFKWAVGVGIISGTSTTTLGPQSTATRAQCAVILRQFERWVDEATEVTTPTPTVKPTPDPFDNRLPDDEL